MVPQSDKADRQMEKQDVILATIEEFKEKGAKFSVLDVAKRLHTSKRTIYDFYKSKEEMMLDSVDYVFSDIEKQHYKILAGEGGSCEKLKQILTVYPDFINVDELDYEKMHDQAPCVYKRIKEHFESKWELTLSVFDECKRKGEIRDFPDDLFRLIMLSIYNGSMGYHNGSDIVKESVKVLFEGLQTD